MKRINQRLSILFVLILIFIQPASAYAAAADNLNEGTYSISAKLSCYVNAMGGVEFGEPLLKSAQLIVDKNGSKKIKLNLTKASVTIYSVTCDTFVDSAPAGTAQESDGNVPNGTIGFYDKNGKLNTSSVTYTMSSDTALNSQNEAVKYVNSITFPVEAVTDTYKLTLFVNSNVMGMQFDPATLTVDWNSVQAAGNNNGSSNSQSSATTSSSSASSAAGASQNTDTKEKTNSTAETQSSQAASQTTNAGNSQNESTSQAVNENAEASENVIQKDGIDIHYVNSDSNLALDTDYSNIPFYVYLNMPVLIGMLIFAGVLIIAGIVFIFISKKQKEKTANE